MKEGNQTLIVCRCTHHQFLHAPKAKMSSSLITTQRTRGSETNCEAVRKKSLTGSTIIRKRWTKSWSKQSTRLRIFLQFLTAKILSFQKKFPRWREKRRGWPPDPPARFARFKRASRAARASISFTLFTFGCFFLKNSTPAPSIFAPFFLPFFVFFNFRLWKNHALRFSSCLLFKPYVVTHDDVDFWLCGDFFHVFVVLLLCVFLFDNFVTQIQGWHCNFWAACHRKCSRSVSRRRAGTIPWCQGVFPNEKSCFFPEVPFRAGNDQN